MEEALEGGVALLLCALLSSLLPRSAEDGLFLKVTRTSGADGLDCLVDFSTFESCRLAS